MRLTILITIILISLANITNAGVIYKDKKGTYIKEYLKNDVLEDTMSMKNCINKEYTRKECIEIFTQIAMDKSEKSGQIVVVFWIDN